MKRQRQSGQTLIIALLILGVLLGLGLVFVALIGRNINQTSRSIQRTQSGDLADAGVRFAHTQLLHSELGADWRPERTAPLTDASGFSRDPDALYLRGGTGFPLRATGDTLLDRGGPDGLGPFTRINFQGGRALVRVLFQPNDLGAFSSPSGAIRDPGRTRQYIRIESVGRVGAVNPNDPTTLAAQGYQIAGFANAAAFRQQLSALKGIDTRVQNQKKMIGMVSCGLIEHARFVTNKFRVTREADLGFLTSAGGSDNAGLGITYEGQQLALTQVIGGDIYNASGAVIASGGGSIFSNADTVFHGRTDITVNPNLGDGIQVAGRIRSANSGAGLIIQRVNRDNTQTGVGVTGAGLNSNSGNFSTLGGLVRDGIREMDGQGFARSVSRKEPPSFLDNDPNTGVNRYLYATRESGTIVGGFGNSGRLGYGEGIYVSASERANFPIEQDREAGDPSRSLPKDWLNPNNPNSIAWKGPFYIPIASYLRLQPDGFEVIRDARSSQPFQRTWRRPDGSDSGTSTIRYVVRRIALPTGGFGTFSLNSIENAAQLNVPTASITDATFANSGRPFNGILYFEGDVRVRGVIPTDQQLTVASAGSVYIEGSITKGVVDDNGNLLTRPSTSMLMLMAKDFVTINTTMIFGPVPGTTLVNKSPDQLPATANPIELVSGENERIRLQSEFLMNPTLSDGRPNGSPNTWDAYARTYSTPGGAAISPALVMAHGADDNGPSLVNLFVEPRPFLTPGTLTNTYLFDRNANFNAGAGSQFAGTGPIPVYGLTQSQINALPRFEILSVPLATSLFSVTNRVLTAPAGNAFGEIRLALQDPTIFDLGLTTLGAFASKNYALARVTANPHDVRIEASIFAEEGSFFVIPGAPFNFDIQDTREAFQNDVVSVGLAAAQQRRYEQFGRLPLAPFFGEALNVRISMIGAISENMPAPIAQQAEWQRRWGWMPRTLPGTDLSAPRQHIPAGWPDITVPAPTDPRGFYLPNLTLTYDQSLAIGSADGANPIRTSSDGLWVLPPMPRLPVSPKFAYFGEENP